MVQPFYRKRRKKKRRKERARPPSLYISQILEWADAHFARMGRWPTRQSGFIRGTVNDTWMKIDSALLNGYRGLRRGSTLALLLMEHRGLHHPHHLPDLTEKQILQWADQHLVRTGDWPTKDSGKVTEAPRETWKGIHHALRYGYRGWPGGSTLARFLQDKRGVRNNLSLPPLTVRQILAWADAHYNRTGQWPTNRSGPITEAPNETWAGVQSALVQKGRGIKKKCSLALLLVKARGAQKHKHKANLTVRQIWTWLIAHKRRTGCWPAAASGRIPEAPGETWSAIDFALRKGIRGLRTRLSLAKLKSQRLGRREKSPVTASAN